MSCLTYLEEDLDNFMLRKSFKLTKTCHFLISNLLSIYERKFLKTALKVMKI